MTDENTPAGASNEDITPVQGNQPEQQKEQAPEQQKYSFAGVPPISERPRITVEDMYKIAQCFSQKVFCNENIAPKLQASAMIARMEYYDPEAWGEVEPVVTIDCTQDPIKLHTGPCDIEPKVIMRMHADIAHRFWLKKVSLMVAVSRRQITAKGPISLLMRLLPILKPSYKMYKESLIELGYEELLNYPDPYVPEEEKQQEPGPEGLEPSQ